ncbi:MAG: glucokinase [Methylococcaceae bacterium]
MILSGDLGGTKSLLAIYEDQDDDLVSIQEGAFPSQQYQTIEALLKDALKAFKVTKINAVCLGVAGPVIHGDCQTTNLPWKIKKSSLQALFSSDNIFLLNDLEATGWGVLTAPNSQFVDLNFQAKNSSTTSNKAVLSAGTGLGEAIMPWHGNYHEVMATEGGHTDFGPNDDFEMALLNFLRKKHSGHISYERIVSGAGLYSLYEFIVQSEKAMTLPDTQQLMQQKDPAAVIGERGLAGSDKACQLALQRFARIYGAEAGNLALKCLPYGGLYLGGGISIKILPVLQQPFFMEGFLNKGRYTELLRRVPVKVCLNPGIAQLGAAHFASQYFSTR